MFFSGGYPQGQRGALPKCLAGCAPCHCLPRPTATHQRKSRNGCPRTASFITRHSLLRSPRQKPVSREDSCRVLVALTPLRPHSCSIFATHVAVVIIAAPIIAAVIPSLLRANSKTRSNPSPRPHSAALCRSMAAAAITTATAAEEKSRSKTKESLLRILLDETFCCDYRRCRSHENCDVMTRKSRNRGKQRTFFVRRKTRLASTHSQRPPVSILCTARNSTEQPLHLRRSHGGSREAI